ncbi:MAG TPA: zinc ribbon domain-containing protein, partial [Streptosporangiaceae bacterium]
MFGRHCTRQHVDADGGVRSRTRAVARGQWQVLIRDHHEGYITWEEYLAIEAKMTANQTSGGARPPREGAALCQGIIYCGCGRHMGVHYQEGRAYYACRARSDQQATPDCQHASAAAVDAAVTRALFTAVAPEELRLAVAAAGEVTARRQRVTRAAELAVERARYQADRAERAFLACEPENRLVARTLETRWEARLRELTGAEAALADQLAGQAPLPEPGQLAETAAQLPALWHAPTTSGKDRKWLLRALIGDVTLLPAGDPAKLRIGLRWQTGTTGELLTERYRYFRTSPAAVDLARQLGPAMNNTGLAAALNQAGHRTAHGRPFDPDSAGNLRQYYKIPFPRPARDGELTITQAAEKTGVSRQTIKYWNAPSFVEARLSPGPVTWWACFPRYPSDDGTTDLKIFRSLFREHLF